LKRKVDSEQGSNIDLPLQVVTTLVLLHSILSSLVEIYEVGGGEIRVKIIWLIERAFPRLFSIFFDLKNRFP
jgi:hypothetical protein